MSLGDNRVLLRERVGSGMCKEATFFFFFLKEGEREREQRGYIVHTHEWNEMVGGKNMVKRFLSSHNM